MKKSIFATLSICALAANAADIGRVIVRQQWPWSTAINVEFELSGVSPIYYPITRQSTVL